MSIIRSLSTGMLAVVHTVYTVIILGACIGMIYMYRLKMAVLALLIASTILATFSQVVITFGMKWFTTIKKHMTCVGVLDVVVVTGLITAATTFTS